MGETDKPVKELQDEAIPAMRSAFEPLRAFPGSEYGAALAAEPAYALDVKQLAENGSAKEVMSRIGSV